MVSAHTLRRRRRGMPERHPWLSLVVDPVIRAVSWIWADRDRAADVVQRGLYVAASAALVILTVLEGL